MCNDTINMTLSKRISQLRARALPVLKKYHITKAGIFGSYARGEEKNSDIDILIDPPKGIGFGFVRIQMDLEHTLHRKVDLVSYKALHPLLKERILREEIRIL